MNPQEMFLLSVGLVALLLMLRFLVSDWFMRRDIREIDRQIAALEQRRKDNDHA